jgi:translation initiation factor 3 subunit L
MSAFQNGGVSARVMDDESDVEEEALVADYQEQVQYEDGMDELEQVTSLSMQQADDIQSRLAAAAQPLDFSASLEVKFLSYDNYCSLFHFILNSDGPVDLEPPSVRFFRTASLSSILTLLLVFLGLGCHRRIYLPVQQLLLLPQQNCATRHQ